MSRRSEEGLRDGCGGGGREGGREGGRGGGGRGKGGGGGDGVRGHEAVEEEREGRREEMVSNIYRESEQTRS